MKKRVKITESDIRRIVKETIDDLSGYSVSHGTLDTAHVASALCNFLKDQAPDLYDEFASKHPDMIAALDDENSEYWNSDEAEYDLNDDLWDKMDSLSPEGHSFGSHPGDGSDLGYWKNNDDDTVEESKHRKRAKISESRLRRIVKESIRKAVNEDDTQEDTWHDVPDSRFIWHGEWSDPEIIYTYDGEDYVLNGNEMEDILWYHFCEYCKENNMDPNKHVDDEVYENFAKDEAKNVLMLFGPDNEKYVPMYGWPKEETEEEDDDTYYESVRRAKRKPMRRR